MVALVTRLQPRSAYDLMAAIALFIAVGGGGAYAAATIGARDIKNNAIHSRHIKDGQVKHVDLGANSVGFGNVKSGSLRPRDLNAAQMPQGAVSFYSHVGDHKTVPLSPVRGVQLSLLCETADAPAVGLKLATASSSLRITGAGTQTGDGSLTEISFTGPSDTTGAASSDDLNLIVRLEPGDKWVRFQVASGFAGFGSGCNFDGLITPLSQ